MTHSRYYAVLTGDIVHSSRLRPGQLEAIRSTLRRGVDAAGRWKRGLVKGKPDFFRGDAWQLLLSDPAMALRVGIFLRAGLRARGLADSRMAIGLGEVERISHARTSLSTGQAFVLSGRALDELTRYSSLTIAIPASAGPLSDWLPIVGHLCDSLVRRWTRRQAQLVCAAIHPEESDYEKLARALKPAVSKQTVAKALGRAHWHMLRETVHRFEETEWQTILDQSGGDNRIKLSEGRQSF